MVKGQGLPRIYRYSVISFGNVEKVHLSEGLIVRMTLRNIVQSGHENFHSL
jgi:hypothetical protein